MIDKSDPFLWQVLIAWEAGEIGGSTACHLLKAKPLFGLLKQLKAEALAEVERRLAALQEAEAC